MPFCVLQISSSRQVNFIPVTEGLRVYPFDQERPCLCILSEHFLHRCFVLQNHLLNDVVWLTMELTCIYSQTFFKYFRIYLVMAASFLCVSLKHNYCFFFPNDCSNSSSPHGGAICQRDCSSSATEIMLIRLQFGKEKVRRRIL